MNIDYLDELRSYVGSIGRYYFIYINVIDCVVNEEEGLVIGIHEGVHVLACLTVVLFENRIVFGTLCIFKCDFFQSRIVKI